MSTSAMPARCMTAEAASRPVIPPRERIFEFFE